jgi:hypothetical protein
LQQEHPEVGHEVAGNPVVRVVEENSHDAPSKLSLATVCRSQTFPQNPNYSSSVRNLLLTWCKKLSAWEHSAALLKRPIGCCPKPFILGKQFVSTLANDVLPSRSKA